MAGRLRRRSRSRRTVTGVILDLDPGGAPRTALAPQRPMSGNMSSRGEISVTLFGSHGRYRTETLNKRRCRLHPSRLWAFDREHRLEKTCRVLIGFNTRRLRGDRPLPVDRREPRPTSWRPTSASPRRSSASSPATASSSPRKGEPPPRRRATTTSPDPLRNDGMGSPRRPSGKGPDQTRHVEADQVPHDPIGPGVAQGSQRDRRPHAHGEHPGGLRGLDADGGVLEDHGP